MSLINDPTVLGSLAIATSITTLASGTWAVKSHGQKRRLENEATQLAKMVEARDHEMFYLANNLLPTLVKNQTLHGISPTAEHESLLGTEFRQNVTRTIDLVGEALSDIQERSDAASKNVVKTVMQSVQSLSNELNNAISGLGKFDDNPEVMKQRMKLEHTNAQIRRRTQGILVLTGGWSGRNQKPVRLYDAIRSAKGTIPDYSRVEIQKHTDYAIVGRAVQPVILCSAELMANAAKFSPPDSPIHVSFQSVPNGLAIQIADGGLGMDSDTMIRAASQLESRNSFSIVEMGESPHFGFPIVSALSARAGIRVSVTAGSPWGGILSVILIPTNLLTNIQQPPQDQIPQRVVRDRTPNGLPKRSRREDDSPEITTASQAAQSPILPTRSSADAAGRMSAFQRGSRLGKQEATDTSYENE